MTELGEGLRPVTGPLRRLWFLPLLAAVVAGLVTYLQGGEAVHTTYGVVNTRTAVELPNDRLDLIEDLKTASRLQAVLEEPAEMAGVSVTTMRSRVAVTQIGSSTLAAISYSSPKADRRLSERVITSILQGSAEFLATSVGASEGEVSTQLQAAQQRRDELAEQLRAALIDSEGAPPDEELAEVQRRLIAARLSTEGGSAAETERLRSRADELYPQAIAFRALSARLDQAEAIVAAIEDQETESEVQSAGLVQSLDVTFEDDPPVAAATNPQIRRVLAAALGSAVLVAVLLLLVGIGERTRGSRGAVASAAAPSRGRTASSVVTRSFLAVVAVVAVVAVAAGLVYALTRDEDSPRSATDDSSSPSPSTSSPQDPTPSEPASTSPPVAQPPDVTDRRRANFAAGDPLPDGATTLDIGTTEPLALRDGVLTHGTPAAESAVSYLETRLGNDVQELGVKVRFADADSGGVALTAWQESVVDARATNGRFPAAGMRLTAAPGRWRLVTFDNGQSIVGRGTYEPKRGANSFAIVRQDEDVWVVDPTGNVRHFVAPDARALAGPWASWELWELDDSQAPAAITAVWAG